MLRVIRFFAFTALLLCTAANVFAQWPNSAALNMLICDHNGEQVLPKIAPTSDGGCYLSWYDTGSGNYDVYLQRLDSNGVIAWAQNGLLIDGQPQDTWITDYDMTVDQSDYCVVTMNDIRAGADRDIYAYRISPQGDFVWGANGLTISSNADFEPDPRVVATTNGNIVFAWQEETTTSNVINLRKVSPLGVDLWNPAIVTLTSTNGLSIPRICAADSDGVILQYLEHQGPNYYDPKHIMVQRFNSAGVRQWVQGGAAVSTAGGIGLQMKPELTSDGHGGAFSYWYDSRDNTLHAFAQHVLTNGVMAWARDGVRLSNQPQRLQMNPSLAQIPGTDDVALFYEHTDADQNNRALGGQRITAAGNLAWGTNGITFVPLNQQVKYNILATPLPGGAAVVYHETTPGSTLNTLVKAFRVDTAGAMVWTNSPLTMCSVSSEKGRMDVCVNGIGQVIAAWQDKRADPNGNMYLQNINPDGSLGSYTPPESPPVLTITSPLDSSVLVTLPLTVQFTVQHFSLSDSTGQVAVLLNGATILHQTSVEPIVLPQLNEGLNVIVLTLEDHAHQPLDPPVFDSIHVTYSPSAAPEGSPLVPTETALLPAFPNPFNPTTSIPFYLEKSGLVRLTVYDLSGREVMTLMNGRLAIGYHTIAFNGESLASGVYFCRLTTPEHSFTSKIVLMK